MKKIITLSIVCLVSGQLFAQNDAKAQTADAKKKEAEVQKQKEANVMSLPQATAAYAMPAATTTPATAQKPTVTSVKPAEVKNDVKQAQQVKQAPELRPTAVSPAVPAQKEK